MSTPRIEINANEANASVWLPTKNDTADTVPMLKLYVPNQGEINILGSGEELYALHERIGKALRQQDFGDWM